MKTKVLFLLAALSLSAATFAQGTRMMYVMKNGTATHTIAVSEIDSIVFKTADRGVVINGVAWATCNVDAPGTFAAKSSDAGMFYQWNRKVAWPAKGNVTNWNHDDVMSDGKWAKANDPSPAGWRVPTYAELQKLLDEEKVTQEVAKENGIDGKRYTDKASGRSIFLPVTNCRHHEDGHIEGIDSYGYYWSSTPSYSTYVWRLESGYFSGFDDVDSNFGFCIRPVAE